MIVLQIIGVGIALIALYMSYLYLKRNVFNKLEFIIWFTIWLGFMIVTITPSSFKFLLETFDIIRMMDFIMIVSFIIIYILGFNNYVVGKQNQKKFDLLIHFAAFIDVEEAVKKPEKYYKNNF